MEAGILLGWYQPELTGLDTSLESSAGGSEIIRKNLLLGYSFSIPLFPSARVGYVQGGSYFSGASDTTQFSRKLIYRMFVLETYFRPLRRLELNFALAPMWNSAVIKLDTKNTKSVWDAQIGNYRIDVQAPEKMSNNYFGFASLIGIRYYIFSWFAVDIKTGFMSTNYKAANWKLDGKIISGPVLKIDEESIFLMQLIFSW